MICLSSTATPNSLNINGTWNNISGGYIMVGAADGQASDIDIHNMNKFGKRLVELTHKTMPRHKHNVIGHTHALGAHKHTFPSHNHTNIDHTHEENGTHSHSYSDKMIKHSQGTVKRKANGPQDGINASSYTSISNATPSSGPTHATARSTPASIGKTELMSRSDAGANQNVVTATSFNFNITNDPTVNQERAMSDASACFFDTPVFGTNINDGIINFTAAERDGATGEVPVQSYNHMQPYIVVNYWARIA